MERRHVEQDRAEALVDQLWRAYAPYRRGRNTIGDLATMLAVLLLARTAADAAEPAQRQAGGAAAMPGIDADEDLRADTVRRWRRALAEARAGVSPLTDLRAVLRNAGRLQATLPDLLRLDPADVFGDDGGAEDLPWMPAFLSALDAGPVPGGAELVDAAELLVERHVEDETLSSGEFHTPAALARLIVELAAPRPGDRVLDPACGTGGILAAAARRIAWPGGGVSGDSVEAHATDHSNMRLATMNLAVHGVERAVVHPSDPIPVEHLWEDGRVDHVLSNPPFNQRIGDVTRWDWPFGPPGSNGNFAWLQLAWQRLAEDGTAVLVMPAGAAYSLSARDAAIRQGLIARRALLAVIALPPNLFSHTSVAVHLWVLARDASRLVPHGTADRVLFVDAGSLGRRRPRRTRVLSQDDVTRVRDRLHAWLREPEHESDEPGFSCAATREEVLERGGVLDPRQYVKPLPGEAPPAAERDVSRTLDELDARHMLASASSTAIRDAFTALGYLPGEAAGPVAPSTSLGELAEVPLPGSAGTRSAARGDARDRLFAGPSGGLVRAEDYVADGQDGVPVVMPRDLTGGGISEATVKRVPHPLAQRLARYRLRPGDIVIARRGELGRCAVVRDDHAGWVCGTGCFLLRPPAELDPDYFAAYLRSPGARAWLEARSTGSLAMKTIPRDVLRALPVAVPDLRTQRAIAAAMTRLDAHERALHEQLALTRALRQDALGGLFTA